MIKSKFRKAVVIALIPMALSGCGEGMLHQDPPQATNEAEAEEGSTNGGETQEEASPEEETLSPEDMDFIKYNYYVEFNNDIIDVLDNIDAYYQVVDHAEEFALLPDSGLTYGYRIYGKNPDIIDDCLYLSGEEPDYGQLDVLVQEMADPLRELMEAFSAISRSNDYADNQYQKAKEYHGAVYKAADPFTALAYEFTDLISEMGYERVAQEEEKMKEEGRLIAYNASRGISIGKEVLDVIYGQEITDETITELDLTEIRGLYDQLVAVVGDLDAATSDNNQLVQESLSNSRPFDGLYHSEVQALEWLIRQVESGKPLDLSGSGAPLGSIGHFSETVSKCIERYNSVFTE